METNSSMFDLMDQPDEQDEILGYACSIKRTRSIESCLSQRELAG